MPFNYSDYLSKNPGKHCEVFVGTIIAINKEQNTIRVDTNRPAPQKSKYELNCENLSKGLFEKLKKGGKHTFWVRKGIKETAIYTTEIKQNGKLTPKDYRSMKGAGLDKMTIIFHQDVGVGSVYEWATKHKCGDNNPLKPQTNINMVTIADIPMKQLYVKATQKDDVFFLIGVD